MAKTIKNIDPNRQRSTQVTQQTDDKEKKNRPVSVYLRTHEREYMAALADRLGVSDHSLRQFAIRFFIDQHRAGQVEIQTESETVKKIIQ